MIYINDKKKCTGCGMCADICPQGAIALKKDSEGFEYPFVDKEKCNNCGLCKKKCPSSRNDFFIPKDQPKVYAAWSKDYKIRDESTSGGVFWEIARMFIEEMQGCVVGAKWGRDWKTVEHYIAYNLDELKLLRGSKYIQSNMVGCYKKIESELQQGRRVLFCGTPCQNAALQIYLGEQRKNIFYLDFICHGINSPLAFEAFVSELECQYGSRVNYVRMKNKKKGWQSLATQIVFENGKEYLADRWDDLWIKGFVGNDLYTRYSCFQCPYRILPRKVSDITVGDFWGIKNESPYDMFKGISAVLVNSEKGKQLFKSASDHLFVKEREIEEVISGNFALLKNPIETEKRDVFFDKLVNCGFSQSVHECIGETDKENKDIYEIMRKDIEKYSEKGEINKEQYLYLNYFSKNVIHKGKGKIIPYKNAIIDMQDSSLIIMEGDTDLEIGTNALQGSKAETYIRIRKYGTWIVKHGGSLYYGTTIEINENALFETGYFSINTGSIVGVVKRIYLGEDVMIGREVSIYDSDFHQLLDDKFEQINPPEDVIIEDHVWLTRNVDIHKGVTIEQGSIIGNQTIVNKNVPPYCVVAGKPVGKVIKRNVNWNRRSAQRQYKELLNKRIILYGYGMAGKRFYSQNKNQIEFIVDNLVKEENVITFEEFLNMKKEINREDFIWIIAAPNHYNEFYLQIRENYSDMLIVSAREFEV